MTHLPDPAKFTLTPGQISLVGAGPGAADLLTLRALDRIRAADVIFYDRLIDAEVLALIPAHVETVNVGKEVGRCKWPQDRIDAAIVAVALQGKRVVRLKSGDPSIFGRAAEEIAAAQTCGIPVEVIPGVTAASAAAASSLRPLTERGRFDRFVVLTATALTGALPQDFSRSLAPGTRVAIYMGIHLARQLQVQLMAAGVAKTAPVMVAQSVATPNERIVHGSLGGLADMIATNGLSNPAIIFVDIETLADVPEADPCASAAQWV